MEEFTCCGCNTIFLGVLVSAVTIRLAYVLYWICRPIPASPKRRLRTLIVLGSGGHTAEMLRIINTLQKDRYVPRFYIAAGTDNMSLQKAQVLEESLIKEGFVSKNREKDAYFKQIYRSREVGQSYFTSIYTTLLAIMHAFWLVLEFRPEVIICNGPGTCIPICLVSYIFKLTGVKWSSIFYIESIARVRRLSLSGLLLYKLHLADQFYVQWPQLQGKYPRSQYVGRIM